MIVAVLGLFGLALSAPWIDRAAGRRAGGVLALGPLACFIYFAQFAGAVAGGGEFRESYAWAPAFDARFSFLLDGLSLLFALLITGIGAWIVVYASAYLEGHRDRGRFFLWLILFMASMLGLVTADNVIGLFVFWELTSVTSYMLIGFDHHRAEARKSALQALLVTASGGLALLAGLLLLGIVSGEFELSGILENGELIRGHALYAPVVVLVLAGCFTKSAQWPFHFWLPNAMEAPTPVSAFLHSSTMVKAGVYLLARMSPALGGTSLWMTLLVLVGSLTMVTGAAMAVNQSQLKRILAYSTVSALGILVLLTGLASWPDPAIATHAATAFVAFLLAHALYKAPLFLVAGTITHETGEKDVTRLGGLRAWMPWTAAAGGLAVLSMAAVPPFFGFVAKELLFETLLEHPDFAGLLTAAAGIASVFFVVAALLVVWRPFFGRLRDLPKRPHEAPFAMWIGPVVLAVLGLFTGIMPAQLAGPVVGSAAAAIRVSPGAIEQRAALVDSIHLGLWHGVNLPLVLGAGIIVIGVAAYRFLDPLLVLMKPWRAAWRFGPEAGYERTVSGLMALARGQTRLLQNGHLRYYLLTTIAMTLLLAGSAFLRLESFAVPALLPTENLLAYGYANFYILAVAGLILAGIFGAVHSRSRLSAIASLGVVGYGVALVYSIHGAPDLAITQFLVETLTVILFILVFYHLPESPKMSSLAARARDLAIALTAGASMTLIVLLAASTQTHDKISGWFALNSYNEAHGRNVVNVILVDFRALDTLGEITVLAISAIGVYALLKFHPGRRRDP